MKIVKPQKYLRPQESIPFKNLMKKIQDQQYNTQNIEKLHDNVQNAFAQVDQSEAGTINQTREYSSENANAKSAYDVPVTNVPNDCPQYQAIAPTLLHPDGTVEDFHNLHNTTKIYMNNVMMDVQNKRQKNSNKQAISKQQELYVGSLTQRRDQGSMTHSLTLSGQREGAELNQSHSYSKIMNSQRHELGPAVSRGGHLTFRKGNRDSQNSKASNSLSVYGSMKKLQQQKMVHRLPIVNQLDDKNKLQETVEQSLQPVNKDNIKSSEINVLLFDQEQDIQCKEDAVRRIQSIDGQIIQLAEVSSGNSGAVQWVNLNQSKSQNSKKHGSLKTKRNSIIMRYYNETQGKLAGNKKHNFTNSKELAQHGSNGNFNNISGWEQAQSHQQSQKSPMMFSRRSHSSGKNLNQDIVADADQAKAVDDSKQVREAATSPPVQLEPRCTDPSGSQKQPQQIQSDQAMPSGARSGRDPNNAQQAEKSNACKTAILDNSVVSAQDFGPTQSKNVNFGIQANICLNRGDSGEKETQREDHQLSDGVGGAFRRSTYSKAEQRLIGNRQQVSNLNALCLKQQRRGSKPTTPLDPDFKLPLEVNRIFISQLNLSSASPSLRQYLGGQPRTMRYTNTSSKVQQKLAQQLDEMDEKQRREHIFKLKKESMKKQLMRATMVQKIQKSKTIDHQNMRQAVKFQQNQLNFIEAKMQEMNSSREDSPDARRSFKSNSASMRAQLSPKVQHQFGTLTSGTVGGVASPISVRNQQQQMQKTAAALAVHSSSKQQKSLDFKGQSIKEHIFKSLMIPLNIKKLKDKYPNKKGAAVSRQNKNKNQLNQMMEMKLELFPPADVLSQRTQKQMSKMQSRAKQRGNDVQSPTSEDFKDYCHYLDVKEPRQYETIEQVASHPRITVQANRGPRASGRHYCARFLRQHIWDKHSRNYSTSPEVVDAASISANVNQAFLPQHSRHDALNTTARLDSEQQIGLNHMQSSSSKQPSLHIKKVQFNALIAGYKPIPITPNQSHRQGHYDFRSNLLGPSSQQRAPNLDVQMNQAQHDVKVCNTSKEVDTVKENSQTQDLSNSPTPPPGLQKLETLKLRMDSTNESPAKSEINQNDKFQAQASFDCPVTLEDN